MIRTVTDPEFVDLVTNPATLAVIAAMGWATPTHTDGYVISKPPGGVRLFWHYDWFCWDDPVSYDQSPPQIFAMYYLQDTTRANGSLRVIPGSHRTHNALHDLLDEPHSAELTKAGDLSHPGFSTRQDEIDVPIRAGDLLLGDARLLHAAHANNSDERRTLVTIWYQPDFDALPERAQAQMMAKLHHPPEAYPAEARAKLATITPRYAGEAVPYERQLYRPCPEV